jgi:guanylate kinase
MDTEMKSGNVILLSGPPASGKDSVTNLLNERNTLFVNFLKHCGCDLSAEKRGMESYVNISVEEFKRMISNGDFIQYHKRYGRFYGVSKKLLNDYLNKGLVPVIHTGRIENLITLESKILNKVYKILIWAKRDDIQQRLDKRQNGDIIEINKRLEAYDIEMLDLIKVDIKSIFDYVIYNDNLITTVDLIEKIIINGSFDINNEQTVKQLEDYINITYSK